MGPESLYCSKWRKITKSCWDLELGLTTPNIEFVPVFSFTTMYLNFMFLDRFLFTSHRAKTHTHMKTHTHTHTDIDSNGYSIVAFLQKHNYK